MTTLVQPNQGPVQASRIIIDCLHENEFLEVIKSKGKEILNCSFRYHKYEPNKKIKSALHMASIFKNSEAVEHLLDLGASAEKVNGFGKTALHLWISRSLRNCTEEKEKEILDLFIQKMGTKINVQDEKGKTPLYAAMKRLGRYPCERSWNIVLALLQAGADPDLTDKKDQTALDIYRYQNIKWEKTYEAKKYDRLFQEFVAGSCTDKLLPLIITIDRHLGIFHVVERYGMPSAGGGLSGYDTENTFSVYDNSVEVYKESLKKTINETFDHLYTTWDRQMLPPQYTGIFNKLNRHFTTIEDEERSMKSGMLRLTCKVGAV